LKDKPNDATLISNIALGHRRIGGILKDKPDEARVEYEAAVAGRKKLYEGDPGNMDWRNGLTRDYTLLADLLMQEKDWRGAAQNYNNALRIVEGIVQRNPTDNGWQKTLAVLDVKRGDASLNRGNEALNLPVPDESSRRIDESTRRIEEALERYRAAAELYQGLSKAGDPRYQDLFDVSIKIGDVLVHQNKYQDALAAYQTASAAADQAAPTQRVVDWKVKLAVALEQAGDGLYHLAGPAGGDPAFYQKALEAVEAAAAKEPDNPDLQTRKAALTAKIEARKSAQ
jgi:tetratricopeptide (TPR) repeat protein